MSVETTIVIADDHPIFREGLRRVMEKQRGWNIVAEAADGKTALRLVGELRPDVAVLDVVMPELNGLAVAREIQRKRWPVSVIFLTMFKEEDIFNEAMDAGIKGYVLKDNAVTDIVSCLRSVAAGNYFISPAISHLLVRRGERARGMPHQQPGLEDLTPCERRILVLIAEGKTSKQIGAELFVSYKTIENHRLNIGGKLDLHGPNALLKYALENRARLQP